MRNLLQTRDAVEAEQVPVIATGTLFALLKMALLVMASWVNRNGISRFLASPWLRLIVLHRHDLVKAQGHSRSF